MASTEDVGLNNLCAMFPDMARDTVGALLAANDGNVERTAEQLLTSEDPSASAASVAAAGQDQPDVSRDEQLAQELARDLNRPPEPPARPHQQQPAQQAGPPLRGLRQGLPDNFLRVPGKVYTPEESAQVLADQRMAAMLQNADFVAAHPEFAGYGTRPYQQQTSAPSPLGPSVLDDLQSMGADMKRRLGALANKWNAKPSDSPAGTGGATGAGGDVGGVGNGMGGGAVPGVTRTAREEDGAEVVSFDQSDATTRRNSGQLGALGLSGSGQLRTSTSTGGDEAVEMATTGSGAKKDM